MGKKRVIKQDQTQLIKETEKIESAISKEPKVKISKVIPKGRIYIYTTYNNTIITLTDERGNTLTWKSAGILGFSGTKKGTPYAASQVALAISQVIKKLGMESVDVFVKGVGSGRDLVLRTLAGQGIVFDSIQDITPIPHDGCRPPKPRRV
ncbi:MAG: 30S ribosomal protein S11 [Minisyncoccia bacterium]